MSEEILSVAIFEPVEGKEEECLAAIRGLLSLLSRKGYSRDEVYRDARHSGRYLAMRFWKSAAARSQAHEDPEVHAFWARLGHLMKIVDVYEVLEPASL